MTVYELVTNFAPADRTQSLLHISFAHLRRQSAPELLGCRIEILVVPEHRQKLRSHRRHSAQVGLPGDGAGVIPVEDLDKSVEEGRRRIVTQHDEGDLT